jgi:hypothetical protein
VNKRELHREISWRNRLKPWIVYDPFTVSGERTSCVESFETEAEATAWLAEKQIEDNDGYCGCYAVPKDEYIQNNLAPLPNLAKDGAA